MKILLHALVSRKKFPTPPLSHVKKVIRKVLHQEKIRRQGEINVVFVDNKKIRELNRKFLGERGSTDVIAFPSDEDFGDVFISIEEAMINAKWFHDTPEREITRLIAHGILHLLGYRDHNRLQQKIMWKRQEAIVAHFHPLRKKRF